jgi:hypothetical protein
MLSKSGGFSFLHGTHEEYSISAEKKEEQIIIFKSSDTEPKSQHIYEAKIH